MILRTRAVPVANIKPGLGLSDDIFLSKIMRDAFTRFTFSIFTKIYVVVCIKDQTQTNWRSLLKIWQY